MKTPLILITNDDGYQSKGIQSLINAVKDFGEIMIVALRDLSQGWDMP